MNKRGARSGLYGIVAAFLLFTAYDLFKARNDTETTMTPAIRIVFIIFFAIAGIALICYAAWYWKHHELEKKDDEDNNALK